MPDILIDDLLSATLAVGAEAARPSLREILLRSRQDWAPPGSEFRLADKNA